MKRARATAGERLVLRRVRETLGPKNMTLEEFRTRAVLCHCRREAKDHDAAIRRAVREVWKARGEYARVSTDDLAAKIVRRIEPG